MRARLKRCSATAGRCSLTCPMHASARLGSALRYFRGRLRAGLGTAPQTSNGNEEAGASAPRAGASLSRPRLLRATATA